jgi:hypothetical protein
MRPDTVTTAEYLLDQRELDLALNLFNHAEAEGADPDRCAAGRWMVFMLSGDFEAAWRESDAIRLRCKPDVHRFWHGEDLRGNCVLVRCLHGLGDSVQMLRFIPALKLLGVVRVTVECAPNAAPLLRCMDGIDEVITWGSDGALVPPHFDFQVEVMELPYILRSTIGSLGSTLGHLRLPADLLQRAQKAVDARSTNPCVGIVWSAGEWNLARSIPLEQLRPILQNSHFDFWNLQGGSVRGQWNRVSTALHLHDLIEFTDSGLVPLAALMAQLDLVITVDTFAAHLAGTLNVPCFLLLQYAADWRWMVNRADSPWYPSLRLFRQPHPQDWEGAVLEMSRSLAGWTCANCAETTAA